MRSVIFFFRFLVWFSLRNLTCARMGCFRAAVQALTNVACDYEVTSVKPEEGCTGLIHMV